MKRELIKKNAKFNSKTSNTVIRVKEIDGDVAIIENVRHGSDNRYKSIPGTERVIDITSIQKSYICGKNSTRRARVQKDAVYARINGDLIRVVRVSGNECDVEGVYQRAGMISPIAGSTRTIAVTSLLNSYKEVK